MSIIKTIVSFYRAGEEKPVERYKARVLIDNNEIKGSFHAFQHQLIDFLGLKEQTKKFGLGQFNLKLYRLAKNDLGKIENYAIQTQQQFLLEVPLLLAAESELNVHVIQAIVQWGNNPVVIIKSPKTDQTRNAKPTRPKPTNKRKSRGDAKDDRALIKKLRDDPNTTLNRNARQQQEFDTLCKEIKNLKGSIAISEEKVKCGLCNKHFLVPLDRTSVGKVSFFLNTHFLLCQKKNNKQKVPTLDKFFTQPLAHTCTGRTAVLSDTIDEVDEEQFEGADAVVSENEFEDLDIPLASPASISDSEESVAELDVVYTDNKDFIQDNEGGEENAENMLFCTICVENAHPLAENLNALIREGKIPEQCLYYKYLHDTTSFAMIDASKASEFRWDRDVCEFFETVKYLGGQRTRNFVRGPGFYGTGRGGMKQFKTFSDFNLCGPSLNASTNCKAGYTTDSGIIKPHLLSFHQFSSHPNADIDYLLSTDNVEVMGVSLALDGTALKPGLEYDARQKRIIGLTYKVDKSYVCNNPVPDPEEIKNNLVTSAEVTFMTSVDNSASRATMPVGVNYHPKSVSGDKMLTQILDTAKTVQVCKRCLSKQSAKNHIVTHETADCHSTCDTCLEMKSVCAGCKKRGHTSYLPSLRCCDNCLNDSVKCRRVTVLAVVTDCEECNKKALLEIQKMSQEETMPPELFLMKLLPDVVHIGKSLKCSWSNWFIELNGQMSNLVLIRTLRDSTDPDVRKALRKQLTLECVRNKDRMAVDPIVRLTRPEVADILSMVSLVVHTIVPEKYRFWQSNQKDVCLHPISISAGNLGNLLLIDRDPDSSSSRLLKIRLHQPADVTEVKTKLKDARDICFSKGVAYLSESGNGRIQFHDMEGKVRLQPKSLRTRADLEMVLNSYKLSLDGNVPTLRKRLSQHLDELEAQIIKNVLAIDVQLSKPVALCMASDDILLCADDGNRRFYQIELERDGVTIKGKAKIQASYPDGIDRIESMTMLSNSVVYFVSAKSSRCSGGLYSLCMETSNIEIVLQNETENCHEIKKVARFKESVVFTDMGARKVKSYDPSTKNVFTLAGDGGEGDKDGTATSCRFSQVYGICVVAETLFVTDAAAGKVKLLTSLSETKTFLHHLGLLYDSFGITCKGNSPKPITPEEVVENVKKVENYISSTVLQVKERYHLAETSPTNGPEGTVSHKTQKSIELLQNSVNCLITELTNLNSEYKDAVTWSTLLTTQVENLHAVSHFKHETFDVLQYALDFGTIAKESLKRMTKWGAKYFTHPSSYYPVPQTGMSLEDIRFMSQLPSVTITKKEEEQMKEWMESYRPVRQRTVRSETTKDKAGALPPAVYATSEIRRSRFCYDEDVETVEDGQAPTRLMTNDFHSQLETTIVPQLCFVNDENIPKITLITHQVDEYESDSEGSDYESDNDDSHDIISNNHTILTRSGRRIIAWTKFDI